MTSTEESISGHLRKPARFANYPGDCSHMVGEVKGPNLLGEWLTCVTADFDPVAKSTRSGFAFGPPPT